MLKRTHPYCCWTNGAMGGGGACGDDSASTGRMGGATKFGSPNALSSEGW